jgi:pimeloyl-ACP methyl ester carboxylesterase
MAPTARPSGPGYLDALSLLSEVADELVVRSVRDTHRAWAERFGAQPGHRLERGISGAVYGGLGLGLRAASRGLARVAETGVGPSLDDRRAGRVVTAAVNGLIGDRLAEERPRMAIPMAVRSGGRDVETSPEGLAAAFPDATGRVAVLLHGLCEDESCWTARRTGASYPQTLAAAGWTPVLLRANTGLGLRANGVALAGLLQRVVDSWPVPVERIALVGHSMGGLVVRAAGAVASDAHAPWIDRVTDVVTLGTPHLGAPAARGVGHGSRGLGRLPETAAFGRILDWRSAGVHDLVAGLAEDVPPLPRARYRLVAATETAGPRHPVGHLVGDLLVRVPSAYGRDRYGQELFPGAEVLHVGRTGHFGLLDHPDVHRALRRWLA